MAAQSDCFETPDVKRCRPRQEETCLSIDSDFFARLQAVTDWRFTSYTNEALRLELQIGTPPVFIEAIGLADAAEDIGSNLIVLDVPEGGVYNYRKVFPSLHFVHLFVLEGIRPPRVQCEPIVLVDL
ncbi:hypothetical protein M3Y99_00462600 [Aphelenchoides fujianensis]|nr:hypothetical protein M3Y99_00462600 [Aphelenchoides fujianensis]